jgi:uncharacterized protein YbbC (DUF1343 family)
MKVSLLIMSLFISLSMPFSLEARVYTGLEVFLAKYTGIVKNKRVGLVTNPTGVNASLRQTVDLLRQHPQVKLVALFAPEHGIRGNVRAGENFSGGKDKKTGLPIYSLYGGGNHQPSKAALSQIDVLIYDIQDVGSRAYTYIWHLAKCMQAAAAMGKTVLVLDRPDVFGANIVDGPVAEKKFLSFIGLYPIPRIYGMTIGELARYMNTEEKIHCHLQVVPMINYRRGMIWDKTGLEWIPTSPHIPSPESACCFAATGTIGEIGGVSTGIGYTLPFQLIAAPWINADFTAEKLNSLNLPGVKFRPIYFKPFYAAYKDKDIEGVQIHVIDPATFMPATTEIAMICHLRDYYSGPSKFHWRPKHYGAFDKAEGTDTVRKQVQAGWNYKKIVASWQRKIKNFKTKRKKYLIYK